jgi:hypothetical protein
MARLSVKEKSYLSVVAESYGINIPIRGKAKFAIANPE